MQMTISKILITSFIISTSFTILSMQKEEKSETKKEHNSLEVGTIVTDDFIKQFVQFRQKGFLPGEKVVVYSNTKKNYIISEIKFWNPHSTPQNSYFTVDMGYGIKDVLVELIGKLIKKI